MGCNPPAGEEFSAAKRRKNEEEMRKAGISGNRGESW
jgi:hypothetical protein